MEYERIDKPQTGIISPSKLRAKLMGLSPTKRKEGSKSYSSRTSPARLEDSEFVKNSLLASASEVVDDSDNLSVQTITSSVQNHNYYPAKKVLNGGDVQLQQAERGDSGDSSVVHPVKCNEDESLDYDSNASSSSFEFHKGDRVAHRSLTRSLSRPMSYKWDDAEKWIMSKQVTQANYSKSHSGQSGGSRMLGMNMVRVAPESGASYDYRLHPRMTELKRVDFCQPTAHMSMEKFNYAHPGPEPNQAQSNGSNIPMDLFPLSKDLKEVGNVEDSTHEVPSTPAIRAISMRDMGTEMTPVTSQEPSRTSTPVGATTPLRSPTSSIPSTPRTGEPAAAPVEYTADNNLRYLTEKGDKELSGQELKLKTRREIIELGVQLGKMNIAAWASKDEKEKRPSTGEFTGSEELEHIEFEKRAAAWEEAEKSKHAARYKREEIKIQAWESQQKAKLEEALRRVEAKVERLRTHFQVQMAKRIATARRQSERKRAAAEAQKKRQAEKVAAQAEYIRQTGRVPLSDYICCGLFT